MHKTQILKDIFFFLWGYDQLKAIEDVDVFYCSVGLPPCLDEDEVGRLSEGRPPHPSVSSTRRKLSFLTSSHPVNTNPETLVCIGQHVASGGHQRREVNLYALSEMNQLPYGRRV